MRVVYVAHRLSGDWPGNTAAAREFVKHAAHHGVAPVAPYLTLDGLLVEPDDRELGLEIDLVLLARCDEVWLCGPVISPGMLLELDAARARGIPVSRWLTVEGRIEFLP